MNKLETLETRQLLADATIECNLDQSLLEQPDSIAADEPKDTSDKLTFRFPFIAVDAPSYDSDLLNSVVNFLHFTYEHSGFTALATITREAIEYPVSTVVTGLGLYGLYAKSNFAYLAPVHVAAAYLGEHFWPLATIWSIGVAAWGCGGGGGGGGGGGVELNKHNAAQKIVNEGKFTQLVNKGQNNAALSNNKIEKLSGKVSERIQTFAEDWAKIFSEKGIEYAKELKAKHNTDVKFKKLSAGKVRDSNAGYGEAEKAYNQLNEAQETVIKSTVRMQQIDAAKPTFMGKTFHNILTIEAVLQLTKLNWALLTTVEDTAWYAIDTLQSGYKVAIKGPPQLYATEEVFDPRGRSLNPLYINEFMDLFKTVNKLTQDIFSAHEGLSLQEHESVLDGIKSNAKRACFDKVMNPTLDFLLTLNFMSATYHFYTQLGDLSDVVFKILDLEIPQNNPILNLIYTSNKELSNECEFLEVYNLRSFLTQMKEITEGYPYTYIEQLADSLLESYVNNHRNAKPVKVMPLDEEKTKICFESYSEYKQNKIIENRSLIKNIINEIHAFDTIRAEFDSIRAEFNSISYEKIQNSDVELSLK